LLLDQNRITTIQEIGQDSNCILNYQKPTPEKITWRKSTTAESISNLKEITSHILSNRALINTYSHFETSEELEAKASQWETFIKNWLTSNSYDTGTYLWPLRVALSGVDRSPSPFELLAVLDKKQIIERLSF
jgi:glutamyl/glutaminyl-tRNA synthetase